MSTYLDTKILKWKVYISHVLLMRLYDPEGHVTLDQAEVIRSYYVAWSDKVCQILRGGRK